MNHELHLSLHYTRTKYMNDVLFLRLSFSFRIYTLLIQPDLFNGLERNFEIFVMVSLSDWRFDINIESMDGVYERDSLFVVLFPFIFALRTI